MDWDDSELIAAYDEAVKSYKVSLVNFQFHLEITNQLRMNITQITVTKRKIEKNEKVMQLKDHLLLPQNYKQLEIKLL